MIRPHSRAPQGRLAALAACAAALLSATPPAHAETFPSRTVRLISPFPAGSGPDAVSRLIGERLGKEWGQAVIVDPRPGGPCPEVVEFRGGGGADPGAAIASAGGGRYPST